MVILNWKGFRVLSFKQRRWEPPKRTVSLKTRMEATQSFLVAKFEGRSFNMSIHICIYTIYIYNNVYISI